MDDLKIRRDILDEIEFNPCVDAANIGVSVHDGIATISGHVRNYAEKTAVETIVQRVKGVRGLAAEIDVRYPEDKKHADDEIAARALDIISWNTALPEGSIGVKVQQGWVTISGTVRWQFQRSAAENAVRRLGGVIGVINLIAISPTLTVTDVKQRIEDALRRDASLEAHSIAVSVDGGRVILDGDIEAYHHRAAVEHAAWSVPGVVQVDNRLSVKL